MKTQSSNAVSQQLLIILILMCIAKMFQMVRTIGHIQHVDDIRIIKQALEWLPKNFKQKPGHCRRKWQITIDDDIQTILFLQDDSREITEHQDQELCCTMCCKHVARPSTRCLVVALQYHSQCTDCRWSSQQDCRRFYIVLTVSKISLLYCCRQ